MNKQWVNEISIEELPEQYRDIAEMYGIDFVLGLAEIYQGEFFYVSRLRADILCKSKEELQKMDISELPEKYRELVKKVDIETVVDFIRNYSDEYIYFPMLKATMGKIQNKHIIKDFDGSNFTELAKKYGVSVQWIRTVIKRGGCSISKNNNQIPENQILFDW